MSGARKRPLNVADLPTMDTVSTKKVPPYDPRQEGCPKSVTTSKEWATLEDGNRHIHHLVTEPFARSEHQDHLTENLTQLATKSLLEQQPRGITVGISGNMGGGKVGNIAREGDSGRSCTLASNLFCASKEDQIAPFLAEVYFYPYEERCDILAGYLRDYYRATYGSDEEDAGASSEEDPAIKTEVTTALLALFKDRPECQSPKEVRRFLEEAQTEDDETIIGKFVQWSDDLIRRAVGTKKTVTVTASTPGDLSIQLERYATETDADDGSSGPSLWPLVTKICFHFNDPLTKLGITFLDTPGLTDRNRTRKLSALLHSKETTHAMIVTDVARAQDDPSVSSEVKKMCGLGNNRVVIVSPKADRIGDATMPSGTKSQKDTFYRLKREHDSLDQQMASIDEQIQTAEEKEDDAESAALGQTKRKLEVLVKNAENTARAHRINMRSEHNKTQLQEKLSDIVKSAAVVPVFSVSNAAYAKHLTGYLPKAAPVLSIEDTNIPDLRRLISTFPNEARLNEARHRQDVTIPSLLSRLQLYTSRTPMERKADLDAHLKKPEMQCDSIIEAVFMQFQTRLQELVVDAVRNEEQDWTVQAGNLCTDYEDNLNPSPFLAVMKRHGHRRRTPKSTLVNMSGDLIGIKSAAIGHIFGKVVQAHHSFGKTMNEDIDELFNSMVDKLTEDANSLFVNLGPFIHFLYTGKPKLSRARKKMSDTMLQGLEEIRRKASFAEEDAYLIGAMIPIYEKIIQLKPTVIDPITKEKIKLKRPPEGWPALRKSTFRKEVTQIGGVCATVYTGIKDDIANLLQDGLTALQTDVSIVFREFRKVFDEMCEAKGGTGPEEVKLQQALLKNPKEAQQHLDGPRRRASEALWKDFR